MNAALTPQIVTAVSTLTGVVLTLAVTAYRERRRYAAEEAEKLAERRHQDSVWLKQEKKALYARFLVSSEISYRSLRRYEGYLSVETAENLDAIESVRATDNPLWDSRSELRLLASDDVVAAAGKVAAAVSLLLRGREKPYLTATGETNPP
jgi:hypothetical protein